MADPGVWNGGVNFCNNVREIKYYFNIWRIKKETKKEGGSEKKGEVGWKFTHFTSSVSAPEFGFIKWVDERWIVSVKGSLVCVCGNKMANNFF